MRPSVSTGWDPQTQRRCRQACFRQSAMHCPQHSKDCTISCLGALIYGSGMSGCSNVQQLDLGDQP